MTPLSAPAPSAGGGLGNMSRVKAAVRAVPAAHDVGGEAGMCQPGQSLGSRLGLGQKFREK